MPKTSNEHFEQFGQQKWNELNPTSRTQKITLKCFGTQSYFCDSGTFKHTL